MSEDHLQILEALNQVYDNCNVPNCAEQNLNDPKIVDVKQCNPYSFYRRVGLFSPDHCDTSKKLPDCLFVNQVYEDLPVDKFANYCIRIVELKSRPEFDPIQPILDKFINCWDDIFEIIGNDPNYHLERPVVLVNEDYPRLREFYTIMKKKKITMKHGKEMKIFIQQYELGEETTMISDNPWE